MKRPLLVTIICILGFIGVILIPFGLFTGTFSPVDGSVPSTPFPTWYIIFSLIITILYLFSTIETWKMRKRGVELYVILVIIEYIVGFMNGFASTSGLVCSIIILGIMMFFYKRMAGPSLISQKI